MRDEDLARHFAPPPSLSEKEENEFDLLKLFLKLAKGLMVVGFPASIAYAAASLTVYGQ